MSTDSRAPIVTRQLGDVVEHACQNPACHGQRWFEPTRSDARYCQGSCRVAAHRHTKAIRETIERNAAERKRVANVIEDHRRRWVGLFTANGVTGYRATALYEAGMKSKLIPAPWTEQQMF